METSETVGFIGAVPKMAASNIELAIEFYEQHLGFDKLYSSDDYGIARRGAVEIHFWQCSDKTIAENTGCRIEVENIDFLHAQCLSAKIVHPNGPLTEQYWRQKDFSILDRDGNLLTFFERMT